MTLPKKLFIVRFAGSNANRLLPVSGTERTVSPI